MNLESTTLANRCIAIPETRELDVFAGLLERRGAAVLRCPLIAIRNAPDPKPVLSWVEQVIAGELNDLILLTGEGVRRLISCIEFNAPQMRAPFVAALANVRKITRGPKPTRALKELGLRSDLAAESPTTEGVIATLMRYDLSGRRVGVQLYGLDPNVRLITWLHAAGAEVSSVAPYIYADSAEDEVVRDLGKKMAAGEIDAIAFTSMQQVQRLFDVLGDAPALSALRNTYVAAIGPLVEGALVKRGAPVQLVPDDAFFLKPLTRALEEKLGPKGI